MRYKTILSDSESILRDRGSKFLAYVRAVSSQDEVEKFLEDIRIIHPKARHICYAYRIGSTGQLYRINDDGEPSGSAGLPIYNQLLSEDITNVMAIVVRYFGGTKLGIPGLIKAYKISVEAALSKTKIVEKILQNTYSLILPMSSVHYGIEGIKRTGGQLIEQKYQTQAELIFKLSQENLEPNLIYIMALSKQKTLDEIDLENIGEDYKLALIEAEK